MSEIKILKPASVCTYDLLFGSCTKDNCTFGHGVCLKWIRGERHDTEECSDNHTHELCASFAYGKCKYGKHCRRLHFKLCDGRCKDHTKCFRIHDVTQEKIDRLKRLAKKQQPLEDDIHSSK